MLEASDTPADRSEASGRAAARRRWRRAILGLLLPLLVVAGLIYALQRRVLFPRHLIPVAAQQAPPEEAEVWRLDTEAGPVEAWFLPAPDATAERPAPLVVFAHGNGELIDFWPDMLRPYRELGLSLLLPEYRGYGRSAGDPSEAAILADFLAFHDRAAGHPLVDAERIVFHGRSLGGAVLACLSRQRAPAAMILQSTFTSVPDAARSLWIPGVLVRDRLDARAALASLDAPVLILHGRRDRIVPPRHAERLQEVTGDGRLVWFDVGHNELPPPREYWPVVGRFLDEVGVLPGGGAR